jgi:hypothetical protein
LFMSGKKALCVSLILLLAVSVALVSIPSVHALVPLISLSPATISVSAPGQNFTVDVNVTDVSDLKGVVCMLDYNASILNATLVSKTAITNDATKWLPIDANGTFHWDGPPTINNTIGRVWVYPWGFTPFTGSGAVLSITFTAIAAGNSNLHFYFTQLLDSMADEIPHDVEDGTVTVIPEFPTFIIVPLLLIATLAATLAKMFWSKKRKDALITE